MGRIVGYLKVKEIHGHIMRKSESLPVLKYCDASYASDPIARKSVGGMIGTLGGMITNWSSRTIKTTALSSTESKYIALGECGQEMKFMCMLLQEVGIGQLTGIIYEDNEGAIFLAKNQ